jgi:hypothetical protein
MEHKVGAVMVPVEQDMEPVMEPMGQSTEMFPVKPMETPR